MGRPKGSINKKRKCMACKNFYVVKEIVAFPEGYCGECSSHVKLCECGCEEEIFGYAGYGLVRRYVNGHNNKGINFLEAHKRKIGHSNKGKQRSAEVKELMRKHVLQRFSNPKEREAQSARIKKYHEDNPDAGKTHSTLMLELWQDSEYMTKQAVIRDDPEHYDYMREENNWMWNPERARPYGEAFNAELKEFIRARHNYACADYDETCKGSKDTALDCHHIDGDKMNNNPRNLVALCRSHHIRAEHDAIAAGRYHYCVSLIYFEHSYTRFENEGNIVK